MNNMPLNSKTKQYQLKGVLAVVMQPELNDSHVPRTKSYKVGFSKEAGEYRERDWGTLWLENEEIKRTFHTNESYDKYLLKNSVVPAKPCNLIGSDAHAIQRKSYGNMEDIIKGDKNKGYVVSSPQPRLRTPEAHGNAKKHWGSLHRMQVNAKSKTSDERSPMRLPTSDAEDNYRKNTGSMSQIMKMQDSKIKLDESPQKMKSASSQRHLTGSCGLLFAGKLPADPIPEARVRLDGKDIYWKHQGSRTFLHHTNHEPSPVDTNEKKNAKNDKYFQEINLSKKPCPRIRPETRKYARKHQGTISECFKRYL